uniref:Uncharacterized protein n=1 Tax=Glossina brevipalpis TaxID=37001 RepID=A0A1A9WNH3_9MUSC
MQNDPFYPFLCTVSFGFIIQCTVIRLLKENHSTHVCPLDETSPEVRHARTDNHFAFNCRRALRITNVLKKQHLLSTIDIYCSKYSSQSDPRINNGHQSADLYTDNSINFLLHWQNNLPQKKFWLKI